MVLLAFIATLFVLSTVGVAAQIRSSDETAALEPCAAASRAAISFQSAVTRDLDRHVRLHADTTALVSELISLGATECPETKRFLVAAEETVAGLCRDCADQLRRVRTNAA